MLFKALGLADVFVSLHEQLVNLLALRLKLQAQGFLRVGESGVLLCHLIGYRPQLLVFFLHELISEGGGICCYVSQCALL